MTLKELQIGKSAVVDTVGGSGALRQHFLDMGLIPGAEVTLVKLAPMGDPMELRIHGYELTLRLDDAAQITVTPTEKTPAVHAPVAEKMVELAQECGVPIYEDNSLATVLTQLELGAEIPNELYQAIVDIYVYFLHYGENKTIEPATEAVQDGVE